ncbi:MAG: AI-2E family transporter [Bryobacteraceae bacterium]|nr:AI-2E family transporter [Bryobacteraceae bacterium]
MTAEDWFSRRALGNFALLAATLLVFFLCWMLIRPFVAVITWALALAVFARPAFLILSKRLRSAGAAAAITVVLSGVIILGPGVLLVNQLVREAVQASESIRDAIEAGRLQEYLESVPRVKAITDRLLAEVDLRSEARRVAGTLTTGVRSVLVGSTYFVSQFFLTLFALFFVLRDFEEMHHGFRSLMPLTDHEMEVLLDKLSNTIYATIYGKFAAAMSQGALGTLIFVMLGLPAPLLWGSAMALLALVPMAGPAIVWVPATLILLAQGAWVKAIIMAAWGVLAIGLVDNFVYPMIVGGRLQLHTLLAFVATFGGLLAFGLSGLVLGPIVLALTLALLQIWRDRTAGPASAGALI